MFKQHMLIVLDGWGLGKNYDGNAVFKSNTPNYDNILKKSPNSKLIASGEEVGLPEGQMGNSEVGHLNIGAGRIIYQELTRINKEIREGKFFDKKEIKNLIENSKKNNSKLHLIGLVSKGGVHSHLNHLFALLEFCKKEDFEDVFIHCFLDGRDVSMKAGLKDIEELEAKIKEIGVGKIASISGRYYAMDRDNRWERVEKVYNAIILGKGIFAKDSLEAINESYKKDITDEFIDPIIITEKDTPVATIDNKDSVLFFNFRPDRGRELTRAIVDKEFKAFVREKEVKVKFATMTQYDKTIENVEVVYKPESYKNTLGEYLAINGKTQLRIAETEKYAHVTFFFNGGVEKENSGETRILVSSPKVSTYDEKPEMSAREVTEKVLEAIESEKYDLIVLNFANPDMVGHTGDLVATEKALEVVDECLGKILTKLEEKGGDGLITADHGNAEEMYIEETKEKITSHTTNNVPLILVGKKDKSLKEGILADIAPTLLELMELKKPEEMTGNSLLK